MKKLLAYQVRENFRIQALLFGVSLVLVIISLVLSKLISGFWAELMALISILGVAFMGAGSLLFILYRDYDRHYGKEAAFYGTLPVSPSSIVASRALSLILGILLVVLSLLICLPSLVFILEADQGPLLSQWSQALGDFGSFLGTLPWQAIFLIIAALAISFVSVVGRMIFAISLGSSKSIKGLGLLGPVIAYIAVKFLEGALALAAFFFVPGLIKLEPAGQVIELEWGTMFQIFRRLVTDATAQGTLAEPAPIIPIGPILVGILVLIFYYTMTYKLRKSRLSVD